MHLIKSVYYKMHYFLLLPSVYLPGIFITKQLDLKSYKILLILQCSRLISD